ncbi:MAG: hypothetical protein PHP39_04585 [Oscillospiraceae bacterium]|nr:hypothetical protein [Oscillospiraceae bacterium]
MNEQLFRKKSMDRIASPEQLNYYVKVSNPGVWIILTSIILLLTGLCVWGIWGKLNTTLTVPAVSREGTLFCYVKEAEASSLAQGMTVRIGDAAYPVSMVSDEPVQVPEDFDALVLRIGGLQTGDWVYTVAVSGTLPEGVYEATIVTDSVAPISFLFN